MADIVVSFYTGETKYLNESTKPKTEDMMDKLFKDADPTRTRTSIFGSNGIHEGMTMKFYCDKNGKEIGSTQTINNYDGTSSTSITRSDGERNCTIYHDDDGNGTIDREIDLKQHDEYLKSLDLGFSFKLIEKNINLSSSKLK